MKNNYIILAFLVLFLLPFKTFSQRNIIQKGNEEFENKNYAKAVELFHKAEKSNIDEDALKEVVFKIAESYRFMNEYIQAADYYNQYLLFPNANSVEVKYKYANILLKLGRIQEAKSIFTELLKDWPENKEYERMVACTDFAIGQLSKENIPAIKNQELLNSEQSEFGLAWFNEELIFASKKLIKSYSNIHGRTNQGFSEIYSSTFDSINEIYSNPILMKGSINSPYNDGTFSYNPKNKIVYFAQCKRKPEKCEIYTAINENDKLTDIKLLALDQSEYNFAHPSINPDGNTLYFASDLPGSIGGKDIWRVAIKGNTILGAPENLGNVINTDKDDMFPLIIGDSILLFSSEGQIGMGGLDVFYSKIDDGIFDKPVNVGVPINSTADDFSILLNRDLMGGYFCTNRNNQEKSDDIFAFYHNIFQRDIHGKIVDSLSLSPLYNVKVIYSTDDVAKKIEYSDNTGIFTIPLSAHPKCGHVHSLKLEKDGYISKTISVPCSINSDLLLKMWNGNNIRNMVTGKVTNKLTGEPLKGATITVRSVRGTNDIIYTNNEGIYFSKSIAPNDYFILRATQKNFLTDSRTIVVPDNDKEIVISEETGFRTDFQLIPILLDNEFRIENIYYEFDKDRLLDESKVELDKLVNILNENPEITIRINSHADSRGSNEYNQELSERRGKSVVNYLVQKSINKERLNSRGYGELKLLIPNAQTEEEHQFNRRTTFEIIGTTYAFKLINEGPEVSSVLNNMGTKANIADSMTNNTESKTKSNDDVVIYEEADFVHAKKVENSPKNEIKIKTPENNSKTRFFIQILATSNPVNVNIQFNEIADIIKKYSLQTVKLGTITKYQIGPFSTREDAIKVRKTLRDSGFTDCFVITQ